MKTKLRIPCSACGYWNYIPVNKAFFEPDSPKPEFKVIVPMYKPLKTSKCENCGRIIAEPEVFIRIIQDKVEYWKEKE